NTSPKSTEPPPNSISPSPSPFAPSSLLAAATPKTRSPPPSQKVLPSTSFSEQASTPSLTETLTHTFESSKSTTLPRKSGSASYSKKARFPFWPTSPTSQSISNASLFPSSYALSDSTRRFRPSSHG